MLFVINWWLLPIITTGSYLLLKSKSSNQLSELKKHVFNKTHRTNSYYLRIFRRTHCRIDPFSTCTSECHRFLMRKKISTHRHAARNCSLSRSCPEHLQQDWRLGNTDVQPLDNAQHMHETVGKISLVIGPQTRRQTVKHFHYYQRINASRISLIKTIFYSG